MDRNTDGSEDYFIEDSREERTAVLTARRTEQLLVAVKLLFAFSHGALVISASLALGWEHQIDWWKVFTPAWLGDAICMVFSVLSWFASVPYIKFCLSCHQARRGDDNPSILTDILPSIFMGILSLLFMIFALVSEILLCSYLDRLENRQAPSLTPCVIILIITSLLACCRGILISTSSEVFAFLGSGAIAMALAALCVPGGPVGQYSWVVILPWVFAALGLLIAYANRFRKTRHVCNREEVVLRAAEQLGLLGVLVSLIALVLIQAQMWESSFNRDPATAAGSAGVTSGTCICIVALLRTRMAILESGPEGSISDRIRNFEMCRDDETCNGAGIVASLSVSGREVGGL